MTHSRPATALIEDDPVPTRRDFLGTAAAAALGPVARPAAPPPDGEPPLPAGAFRRLGSARFRGGSGRFEATADGRFLVGTDFAFVYVLDAATGRRVRRFPFHDPRMVYAVHFAPAGRVVRLTEDADRRHVFETFDLDGRRVAVSPPGRLPRREDNAFDPAGGTYYHASKTRLAAFDTRSFALRWAFDYDETDEVSLDHRPGGGDLLFRREGYFMALDPATGALRRRADLSGRFGAPQAFRVMLSDDGALGCFQGNEFDVEGVPGREQRYAAVFAFDPGRVLWAERDIHDLAGFSADGRTVFAQREDRWLRLDARTGRRLVGPPLGFGDYGFERTADPNVVSYASGGGGVAFLDLTTGRVLAKSADPRLPLTDLRFDPAGWVTAHAIEQVAAGTNRWTWQAWDPAGGPPAVRSGDLPRETTYLPSPDGRRYALFPEDRIELYDAATGRRLAAAANPYDVGGGVAVSDIAWAADASAVAVTAGHKTVVVSAETGLGHKTTEFAGFPGGPEFRTAAGARRRVAHLAGLTRHHSGGPSLALVTCDPAGGDRKTVRMGGFELTGRADRAGRYAGKRTLRGNQYGSEQLQLREAETGEVVWELPPRGDGTSYHGPPIPSPDGRTVAVPVVRRPAETAGVVEFHEAFTGGLRRTLAFETEVDALAFDRRGRTLVTAHTTAPIFLWDVYGERTAPIPKPDADGWEKVWAGLSAADAAAGYRAVCAVVQHPSEAAQVLWVAERAYAGPDADLVRAWAGLLGSPHYREREEAETMLAAVADECLATLGEVLAACTNAEAKARLERLIGNAGRPTPRTIRAVRMVEGLEASGAPAAKSLLAVWAAGPAGRVLTREATAALDRWE